MAFGNLAQFTLAQKTGYLGPFRPNTDPVLTPYRPIRALYGLLPDRFRPYTDRIPTVYRPIRAVYGRYATLYRPYTDPIRSYPDPIRADTDLMRILFGFYTEIAELQGAPQGWSKHESP